MYEKHKYALLTDYGVDIENEARGESAFEWNRGIVFLPGGEAAIKGGINLNDVELTPTSSRGVIAMDALSMPLGLEVESILDLRDYDSDMRHNDAVKLKELLNIGHKSTWHSDAKLEREVLFYPQAFMDSVLRDGHPLQKTLPSTLFRVVSSTACTIVKIPPALIAPEQPNARMALLRKIVLRQMANVTLIHMNSGRRGGISYHESITPLMTFVKEFGLVQNVPKEHETFLEQFDDKVHVTESDMDMLESRAGDDIEELSLITGSTKE